MSEAKNKDIIWDDEVSWDQDQPQQENPGNQQPIQQAQGKTSIISQLVRSVMRNSPMEQMKTAQYMYNNQDSIPSMQQGQSLSSYAQNLNQNLGMQQREQQIVQGGTMKQLSDVMVAGLAVAGVSAPIAVLKSLVKFGIMEGAAEVTGLNQAIKKIPSPTLSDTADVIKFLAEGALATKKIEAPKLVRDFETKVAGKIVNSLIRPTHKSFMFGKNPGEGIAKEGIIAGNMESLYNKVDERISLLNKQVETIRATPENVDKKLDLSDIVKPLQEVYTQLNKAPETQKAEIQKIQGYISDIQRNNLKDISVSDAYNIKGIVSDMQSWKNDTVGGKLSNIALRKVYHLVDSKIDKAIPELEQLNSRMADLISAKTAISNRVETLQKTEPVSWRELIEIPFKVYRSTPSKTALGALLAKKYQSPPDITK